jgi:hypothetical protein
VFLLNFRLLTVRESRLVRGSSAEVDDVRNTGCTEYGTEFVTNTGRQLNTGRCQLRQLPHLVLFRITDPTVVSPPRPDDARAARLPGVRQRNTGPDGDGQDLMRSGDHSVAEGRERRLDTLSDPR